MRQSLFYIILSLNVLVLSGWVLEMYRLYFWLCFYFILFKQIVPQKKCSRFDGIDSWKIEYIIYSLPWGGKLKTIFRVFYLCALITCLVFRSSLKYTHHSIETIILKHEENACNWYSQATIFLTQFSHCQSEHFSDPHVHLFRFGNADVWDPAASCIVMSAFSSCILSTSGSSRYSNGLTVRRENLWSSL